MGVSVENSRAPSKVDCRETPVFKMWSQRHGSQMRTRMSLVLDPGKAKGADPPLKRAGHGSTRVPSRKHIRFSRRLCQIWEGPGARIAPTRGQGEFTLPSRMLQGGVIGYARQARTGLIANGGMGSSRASKLARRDLHPRRYGWCF